MKTALPFVGSAPSSDCNAGRSEPPDSKSDDAPHALPAEDVTVDDVESFVACRRCGGSPRDVARQKSGIRHVRQGEILGRRTGKNEWPARLPADRGMGRERHADVHGVADRVAHDGVRPVDAPVEPVAIRELEDNILLHVIEVLDWQARLILTEWRLGLAFRMQLERAEIVLRSCDERDVSHRARLWRHRL